jgi:hypothetical protein
MKLGRFDLQIATDGEFRRRRSDVRRGAEDDVERAKALDEKNRSAWAQLPAGRTGADLVLIDTGIGDKHEAVPRSLRDRSGARRLPSRSAPPVLSSAT